MVIDTVSSFVQYVVTIAKLNTYIYNLNYTRDLVPPSNKRNPPPPYKRRMPNITAYEFLSIHQPEDGHKCRNM